MENSRRNLAKSLTSIGQQVALCGDWEDLKERTASPDTLIWSAFQDGILAGDAVITNRLEHWLALTLEAGPLPKSVAVESGVTEYLIGQAVRLPNFPTEMPWDDARECAKWFSIGLCDLARRLHGADSKPPGEEIPFDKIEVAYVSASVQRGVIIVGKSEHHAPAHHCQIVQALANAEGDYVTGPTMTELPGCAGKKISREIASLEKAIPSLKSYLKHEGNRGYRMVF